MALRLINKVKILTINTLDCRKYMITSLDYNTLSLHSLVSSLDQSVWLIYHPLTLSFDRCSLSMHDHEQSLGDLFTATKILFFFNSNILLNKDIMCINLITQYPMRGNGIAHHSLCKCSPSMTEDIIKYNNKNK
jgi:hypothetical protein